MTELSCDAFVDGAWHRAPQRFLVRDPFDDSTIADVADCDDALIDAAVDAATRALPAWRHRPAGERGKLLAQLAARMVGDEQRLAALCTRENGKWNCSMIQRVQPSSILPPHGSYTAMRRICWRRNRRG